MKQPSTGTIGAFVGGFVVCAVTLKLAAPGDSGRGQTPPAFPARSLAQALPHGSDRYTVADAVDRIEPAVVNIEVSGREGGGEEDWLRRFLPRRRSERRSPPPMQGVASGVIVTRDGYVVTNHHVVEDADAIRATLPDGREFTGKVVGSDEPSDLAIVKLDGRNLPVAPLGDSRRLRVGEWVIAIGNPLGLGSSVTVGVLSAERRRPFTVQGRQLRDMLQTDAAINQGNSGGALVNLDGELVGINTAIISTSFTGGNIGIGFAIPINTVKPIINQLIAKGRVVRPWIGIAYGAATEAERTEQSLDENGGVVISQVVPDSPALRGGVQAGDVLRAIGKDKVHDAGDVAGLLEKYHPGDRVELRLERDGRSRTVRITLDERPAEVSLPREP